MFFSLEENEIHALSDGSQRKYKGEIPLKFEKHGFGKLSVKNELASLIARNAYAYRIERTGIVFMANVYHPTDFDGSKVCQVEVKLFEYFESMESIELPKDLNENVKHLLVVMRNQIRYLCNAVSDLEKEIEEQTWMKNNNHC